MRLLQLLYFLSLFLSSSSLFGQSSGHERLKFSNSSFDEQAPRISPDGNTLYLTIAHHPKNINGLRDPGDIWTSAWTGEGWSLPVHGGNLINNGHFNSVVGFSTDGSQLLLSSHYSSDGPVATQGFSVSTRTDAGWSMPQNIVVPYFWNKAEATHGFLSSDGHALIFSAESYGTYGAEDLYITFQLPDGNWSEPRNLGASINTKFQDVSPSFSDDGKYLYFSTNGRGGYGSFDVFVSERLDDSWLKWSAPVNLKSAINTEGRELFYHPYSRFGIALFTSTLNSDGYGDVKQQLLPEQQRDSTLQMLGTGSIKIVEVNTKGNDKVVDDEFLKVSGKVFNAKTNLPITAAISFQSDSSFSISTNNIGFYEAMLPKARQYQLKIESPGYVSSLERLDVRTIELRELEMSFKLQPIEVGTTVNLRNVLFQQSTAELLAESRNELDLVADFLTKNPTVEIELAGHTDNRGLHAHNLKLSNERVKAVKSYLVEKGISSKRVTGKGYGGTRPIADNDAEDTRKLNRRVEFTIVKR